MNYLSLVGSASCVLLVVDRSTQPEADSSWWRQNETTIGKLHLGEIEPN